MYNPSANNDPDSKPKEEIHECKKSGNYSIGVIIAALKLIGTERNYGVDDLRVPVHIDDINKIDDNLIGFVVLMGSSHYVSIRRTTNGFEIIDSMGSLDPVNIGSFSFTESISNNYPNYDTDVNFLRLNKNTNDNDNNKIKDGSITEKEEMNKVIKLSLETKKDEDKRELSQDIQKIVDDINKVTIKDNAEEKAETEKAETEKAETEKAKIEAEKAEKTKQAFAKIEAEETAKKIEADAIEKAKIEKVEAEKAEKTKQALAKIEKVEAKKEKEKQKTLATIESEKAEEKNTNLSNAANNVEIRVTDDMQNETNQLLNADSNIMKGPNINAQKTKTKTKTKTEAKNNNANKIENLPPSPWNHSNQIAYKKDIVSYVNPTYYPPYPPSKKQVSKTKTP
jgi:hypothetical protein